MFSSRLQRKETSLVQSQRCIQELTNELRNRCLELRDMHVSAQQHEKLLQVSVPSKRGLAAQQALPDRGRPTNKAITFQARGTLAKNLADYSGDHLLASALR